MIYESPFFFEMAFLPVTTRQMKSFNNYLDRLFFAAEQHKKMTWKKTKKHERDSHETHPKYNEY